MWRYSLAVLFGIVSQALANPVWTETFDNGVGRFDLTSGLADSSFVHDAGDGDLNATFVRRDVASFEPDRRLATLDATITNADVVGFSVEWTPIGGDATAFPRIGFFDTATMADVAVLALTDSRYQIEIGRGQPDAFHIEDAGLNYADGETYLLKFTLDGPAGLVTLTSSIWQGGIFIPEGTNSWSLGTSYSFDALGIGNTVDDQFGQTFHAEFDNFSLTPEPTTALFLLVASVWPTARRVRRSTGNRY